MLVSPQRSGPPQPPWVAGKLKLELNDFSPVGWPSSSAWATGRKFNDEELMQYRKPVGCGPSVNKCPRWARQLEQLTSVLTSPGFAIRRSRLAPTAAALTRQPSMKGQRWRDERRSRKKVIAVVHMLEVVDQSHVESGFLWKELARSSDVRCACPCQKESNGATDRDGRETTSQGDKEKISLPHKRLVSNWLRKLKVTHEPPVRNWEV